MTLSDEDMRRIDEEEYRKLARERLERTVRIEADIRTSGDQRLEVRGVGAEMYGDAKGAAGHTLSTVYNFFNSFRWVCVVIFVISFLRIWIVISDKATGYWFEVLAFLPLLLPGVFLVLVRIYRAQGIVK